MTRIDVSAQIAAVAPSLGEPEWFLPAPGRPAGPDRWTVDLAVGPFHHEAVLTIGPLWRSDGRTGRPIAWQPARRDGDLLPYEALMPKVHGMLVLDGQRLALRAHYTPAAGRLGRLIDPVLRPIARRSIDAFCRQVARTIDARVPVTPGGGS